MSYNSKLMYNYKYNMLYNYKYNMVLLLYANDQFSILLEPIGRYEKSDPRDESEN